MPRKFKLLRSHKVLLSKISDGGKPNVNENSPVNQLIDNGYVTFKSGSRQTVYELTTKGQTIVSQYRKDDE